MEWEIKPYIPVITLVDNKSSRVIDSTPVLQGILAITGSLDFVEVGVNNTSKRWITFTNTGDKAIELIGTSFPDDITYYGSIPSVLVPDDDFTIQIQFTPTEAANYAGNIVFIGSRRSFAFPYSGIVTVGNFRYDGTVYYNNLKAYSGSL